MKTAVIVLPTYNEEGNIEKVLPQIFDVAKTIPNWNVEVLVVDSNSQDKTATIVKDVAKKNKKLHLLETPKEGLGKAYIKGFTYAIDKLGAFVVFEMDADLSHDPKEIPNFLKEIEKGADMVVGSRYMKGGSIPKDWGLDRKLYSLSAHFILRFGFMKLSVTEWTNGFRAIKAWLVKDIVPSLENYSGYVFQVAFLDQAIKRNARLKEIPNTFIDRTEGTSKINSIQYIVNTFTYMFTHSSFIKYVFVGLGGFIVDFGISYLLIEKAHWKVWLSTMISTESAIVFNFIMNNYWAFSHKKLDHRSGSFFVQFGKFNTVALGSVVIQTVGITLLSALFGQHLWALYKIAIIAFVVIPYSYFFYNKFIWKDK